MGRSKGGREQTREQEFDVLVGSMARETLESEER